MHTAERHLGHEEHRHLEDLAGSLQRVLLLAPHGYPVRSFLSMFRELVPEIVCVQPSPNTQVVVAAAAKDASNGTSREIGRYIQGSRTQEIPFKGPAFRSLPANNTVVSLLEKENQDN